MATNVDERPVAEGGSGEVPVSSSPGKVFRIALWTARLMLFGQLVWLIGFSTLVYRRGRLTWDFASFYQPAWLIAHGHLNPYDTPLFMSFWKVNGDWIIWPLAFLTRLPGGGVWLPWVQDLAIFGCGWVVIHWVAEAALTRYRPSRLWPWAAVLLVAALYVGNPWIYSSAGFDFHFEEITSFFVILAAWDLYRGRTRRMWVWVVLALSTHVVASVYIIGVGLAGLVAAGKRLRRTSLLVIGSGVAWFALMLVLHTDQASPLIQGYGYLANPGISHPSVTQMAVGAVTHPSRPIHQLWSNRDNAWANLSPSGFIGIFSPWGFFTTVAVLAPSFLFDGHAFALPLFQNFGAYPFVTLGTGLVLLWIGMRREWFFRLTPVVAVGLILLTTGWAREYLPTYGQTYLEVPPSGSRVLDEARAMIPSNAPVVASDLIAGRFADREQIYVMIDFPERIPLDGKTVYFVVSTSPSYRGADTDAFLGQVTSLGAQIVLKQNGIWLLRWTPPVNLHSIVINGASGGLPAWLLQPGVGAVVTTGAPSTWRMQGTGAPGVVSSITWAVNPGRYVASAQIATSHSALVKVVDAQTGQTIASEIVTGTGQPQSVVLPFTQPTDQPYVGGSTGFHGSGPFDIFRAQSSPSAPSQQVVLEVSNPGTSIVSVYDLGVKAAG